MLHAGHLVVHVATHQAKPDGASSLHRYVVVVSFPSLIRGKMSEMYPPPAPHPGNEGEQNLGGGPGRSAWTPAAAPSQPWSPQPPLAGAPPSQPMNAPQMPPQAGVPPEQPYNPYNSQYPPMGPTGNAASMGQVAPGHARTNLAEYWKNARHGKRNLSVLAGALLLLIIFGVIVHASSGGGANNGSPAAQTAGQTSGASGKQANALPAATALPTHTPAPTDTAALPESPSQYKASATQLMVADIAKDANGYKGKTIVFTAVIANFVQDSSGNTAGANVEDPNDYSSVIQVVFTPSFSLAKVNKGDTITVWGVGLGSFSGTNAYGGTIQEGGVQEVYLDDTTTGYSDTTITDPAAFAASAS